MPSQIIPVNTIVPVTTVAANNADMVASMDVSLYRSATFQITAITTAQVQLQVSLDNSTFTSLVPIGSSGVSLSGSGFYTYALPAGVFMRIRTATWSSGNVSGILVLSSIPLTVNMIVESLANPNLRVSLYNGASEVIVASAIDATTALQQALLVNARQMLYNGASVDITRTPAIFKTATATASGDTALWTPTSTKKFRLMRFRIEVTADVATSGGAVIDVVLRDATTGLAAAFSFYAPSVSVTTNMGVSSTGWIDMGNGILSAVANNVLNINLSATLTSGKVRVIAVGTEE